MSYTEPPYKRIENRHTDCHPNDMRATVHEYGHCILSLHAKVIRALPCRRQRNQDLVGFRPPLSLTMRQQAFVMATTIFAHLRSDSLGGSASSSEIL